MVICTCAKDIVMGRKGPFILTSYGCVMEIPTLNETSKYVMLKMGKRHSVCALPQIF